MARKVQARVDGYPSLVDYVCPISLSSVFVLTPNHSIPPTRFTYFARWCLPRRLRVHGIGDGAPGIQTGARRVRVTPDLAAHIQRGEEISPEELALPLHVPKRKRRILGGCP
ncbi:hypothetical protein CPB85DRAFT_361384 [Mucidula mucida]|nr:hypothetical protein CPB85DRAFT_361384 [Mucidula mucida]